MLRIATHDHAGSLRFHLEGRLAGFSMSWSVTAIHPRQAWGHSKTKRTASRSAAQALFQPSGQPACHAAAVVRPFVPMPPALLLSQGLGASTQMATTVLRHAPCD